MAKLSFAFRHVSPSYYEVVPFYFADGESQPSRLLASKLLGAVIDYATDSSEFSAIKINLLQSLPFANDLFLIGSKNISGFVQSLASASSTSGFDNFTFVGLDGNSFVIELSIGESISHYFNFNDVTHESEEQKKKA